MQFRTVTDQFFIELDRLYGIICIQNNIKNTAIELSILKNLTKCVKYLRKGSESQKFGLDKFRMSPGSNLLTIALCVRMRKNADQAEPGHHNYRVFISNCKFEPVSDCSNFWNYYDPSTADKRGKSGKIAASVGEVY
jgi:hypothetical protein